MPRVAAKLDVGAISDITGVKDEATFVRTIYAGNAVQTVQSEDPVRLITVRGTAFSPVATSGGQATTEDGMYIVVPSLSTFSSFRTYHSSVFSVSSVRMILPLTPLPPSIFLLISPTPCASILFQISLLTLCFHLFPYLNSAPSCDMDSDKTEWLGEELSKSDRPELTSANIVISGGESDVLEE